MTLDVLVVTGGHLFEADPFFAVFDAIDDAVEDIAWTAAGAPTTGHDVVVFYDMPGVARNDGWEHPPGNGRFWLIRRTCTRRGPAAAPPRRRCRGRGC